MGAVASGEVESEEKVLGVVALAEEEASVVVAWEEVSEEEVSGVIELASGEVAVGCQNAL